MGTVPAFFWSNYSFEWRKTYKEAEIFDTSKAAAILWGVVAQRGRWLYLKKVKITKKHGGV
ncbi:hypothetical protein COT48_02280 [Candidatus Woesearchaeota archaeon CG08_land_8_20_14_0_20_47_9]|nr:MAG: hypothetical protein AUJ69_02900 [Candidatus Woesearchaeota archaeon CG1_02_47_18]PIN72355.1 MAG: hypothetical protein COV22_03430 [Candidatus Woesearchaeota archaeon CG10_big_fil_rev_8_21_14_0_10_47_5]PIO04074.1 MAG: hypothetical protein COT48_02280 [Candidatus Woesearchaeota archaeon CG08_land_8_20_14_0_20_47_9]HII30186.1 hypothetical protein [Candidatus Woesearchaeota archaeon]